MKIGFVFTNYNNTAHTENLLNSLSQVRYIENSHIVIVDNDSDYSNRQNLIRLCEGLSYVSLVLNTENCGYFKGLNKGISFLRDLNPEFDVVVIGNNDLKFNSDFIESVQKNDAILTQYPVISPDIVTADGGHQNPHVIKKISLFRECIYDLYYYNYYLSKIILFFSKNLSFTKRMDHTFNNKPMEIFQGYGACYVLGPLFFKHFNLLWAPTFLMGEEYFLTLQIKEEGFPIFYEPAIRVFHSEHASTKKIPSRIMWEIACESHKVYRKYKSRIQ